jgi:nucleoside-diphosphate-sugar epimerase
MRVAITGAGGFIGGQVALALAARGDDVRTFGRRPNMERLPNYRMWDITAGPIAHEPVDAVVHCAAAVGDWGNPAMYHAANIDGTHHVLDSFASARRVIHMSSTSVYSDDVGPGPIAEDADIGRCRWSVYGRTKADAERLVRAQRPDAVVLRPHIVYGAGDTTLLPRLLASRRFGRLLIPGTGRNRISVTHVENLVHAVLLALDHPTARGVFNVADDEAPTTDAMLRSVLARLGVPADIVYVPRAVAWAAASVAESLWPRGTALRGPSLTRYVVKNLADEHVVNIARAREGLGYQARWCYRDGPLA